MLRLFRIHKMTISWRSYGHSKHARASRPMANGPVQLCTIIKWCLIVGKGLRVETVSPKHFLKSAFRLTAEYITWLNHFIKVKLAGIG